MGDGGVDTKAQPIVVMKGLECVKDPVEIRGRVSCSDRDVFGWFGVVRLVKMDVLVLRYIYT